MNNNNYYLLSVSRVIVVLASCLVAACVLPGFAGAAEPPIVESESASNVTPSEARMEAIVNPNNQSTSCEFQYGPTASYGSETVCEPPVLEGEGGQGVGFTLTGLTPGSTIHYRVVVENAAKETIEGADTELTTPTLEDPAVDGESFSKLFGDGVTLEAQVNPDYQETTYEFEYATNEALTDSNTVEGSEPLYPGFGDQLASVKVLGLSEGTTYFYRVLATNTTGTTTGTPQSFITPATPEVTTGSAEGVTRTGALVNGTVNPSGVATTFHVVYVEADKYAPGAEECPQGLACAYAEGNSTSESQSVGEEHEPVPVQAELKELRAGTTYHYALVATNAQGTTTGADQTLTTSPATPPVASTGDTTGITASSATLTATVDTRGLPTTLQFEIATTPENGYDLAASIIPGSVTGSTLNVTVTLNDLQPATTYYYRVIATGPDGTSYGAVRTLTTTTIPGTPALPTVQLVSWPSFVTAVLTAAEHETGTPAAKPRSKHLTRKQLLARALRGCKKQPKKKRAHCRKTAQRRYR